MPRNHRDGAPAACGGTSWVLYANGGHCSHNHSLVLTRVPPTGDLHGDSQLRSDADAMRGPIPLLTVEIEGALPLETYTVVYRRDARPAYGVTLSRGPSGERVIARIDPNASGSIGFLTDGALEPIGRLGFHRRIDDRLVWSVA